MLMRLEKLRQADLNLLIMFAATVEEKRITAAADLAQVLLGYRPAARSPSTADDLRGRCGRSVAHSGHWVLDSGSQSQALADLPTARAVI